MVRKKFLWVIQFHYSDKPGKQDFKILRKLVLPDGSVLRARYAGRPTRKRRFIIVEIYLTYLKQRECQVYIYLEV